jgi:NAD(P)H-nitrite reductase large subunit
LKAEFCCVGDFDVVWLGIDIHAAFWRVSVPQIVMLASGCARSFSRF